MKNHLMLFVGKYRNEVIVGSLVYVALLAKHILGVVMGPGQ